MIDLFETVNEINSEFMRYTLEYFRTEAYNLQPKLQECFKDTRN